MPKTPSRLISHQVSVRYFNVDNIIGIPSHTSKQKENNQKRFWVSHCPQRHPLPEKPFNKIKNSSQYQPQKFCIGQVALLNFSQPSRKHMLLEQSFIGCKALLIAAAEFFHVEVCPTSAEIINHTRDAAYKISPETHM